MTDPAVRLANASEHAEIARFYRDEGYTPLIEPIDVILIAELAGRIAGAARISCEYDRLVLRGMRVRSDIQRQRIGTHLLRAVETVLERRPCYCLPFAHLLDFYRTAAFVVVADEVIPPFLRTRAERYRKNGENVVPMLRRGLTR